MLLRPRPIPFAAANSSPFSCLLSFQFQSRNLCRLNSSSTSREMDHILNHKPKRGVDFRLCNVSSYTIELLEIKADDPTLHVLFIPGNPGIVQFYTDFVESLFELLGGSASVTAIGHIAQTKKNWEHGRLFSLEEQIDHKVNFIRQELPNPEVPIVVKVDNIYLLRDLDLIIKKHEEVGHSIGSYMSIEVLRRCPEVVLCVGLYPFLKLNLQSRTQSIIGNIAASSIISSLVSFIVASLGSLPKQASRLIVSKSIGKSWSKTAIDALCSHLLQYHVMRNVLFLAMTEFRKLSDTPDWTFMRENQGKILFLFGCDDHWGPLQMFEEISKQIPDISLCIEKEGHTHGFCCTKAGSLWVAEHVTTLIKNRVSSSSQ